MSGSVLKVPSPITSPTEPAVFALTSIQKRSPLSPTVFTSNNLDVTTPKFLITHSNTQVSAGGGTRTPSPARPLENRRPSPISINPPSMSASPLPSKIDEDAQSVSSVGTSTSSRRVVLIRRKKSSREETTSKTPVASSAVIDNNVFTSPYQLDAPAVSPSEAGSTSSVRVRLIKRKKDKDQPSLSQATSPNVSPRAVRLSGSRSQSPSASPRHTLLRVGSSKSIVSELPNLFKEGSSAAHVVQKLKQDQQLKMGNGLQIASVANAGSVSATPGSASPVSLAVEGIPRAGHSARSQSGIGHESTNPGSVSPVSLAVEDISRAEHSARSHSGISLISSGNLNGSRNDIVNDRSRKELPRRQITANSDGRSSGNEPVPPSKTSSETNDTLTSSSRAASLLVDKGNSSHASARPVAGSSPPRTSPSVPASIRDDRKSVSRSPRSEADISAPVSLSSSLSMVPTGSRTIPSAVDHPSSADSSSTLSSVSASTMSPSTVVAPTESVVQSQLSSSHGPAHGSTASPGTGSLRRQASLNRLVQQLSSSSSNDPSGPLRSSEGQVYSPPRLSRQRSMSDPTILTSLGAPSDRARVPDSRATLPLSAASSNLQHHDMTAFKDASPVLSPQRSPDLQRSPVQDRGRQRTSLRRGSLFDGLADMTGEIDRSLMEGEIDSAIASIPALHGQLPNSHLILPSSSSRSTTVNAVSYQHGSLPGTERVPTALTAADDISSSKDSLAFTEKLLLHEKKRNTQVTEQLRIAEVELRGLRQDVSLAEFRETRLMAEIAETRHRLEDALHEVQKEQSLRTAVEADVATLEQYRAQWASAQDKLASLEAKNSEILVLNATLRDRQRALQALLEDSQHKQLQLDIMAADIEFLTTELHQKAVQMKQTAVKLDVCQREKQALRSELEDIVHMVLRRYPDAQSWLPVDGGVTLHGEDDGDSVVDQFLANKRMQKDVDKVERDVFGKQLDAIIKGSKFRNLG